MTTQPETQWSGAVHRELDGLTRTVDSRLAEFNRSLDKLLTLTEYHADQRATEIRFGNTNEKIHEAGQDIETIKRELRDSFNALQREILAERERFEGMFKEEKNEQKSRFRWLVSMVMIPLAIAVVDLIVRKK